MEGFSMEKLMSYFYKLVAIVTILYLMITIYLMSLGDSLITREGWYVIILSSFILVIVFGLEYARRRFLDSLFELMLNTIGMLCIGWLMFVVRAFGVTVNNHASSLQLNSVFQQIISGFEWSRLVLFILSIAFVIGNGIRYLKQSNLVTHS